MVEDMGHFEQLLQKINENTQDVKPMGDAILDLSNIFN